MKKLIIILCIFPILAFAAKPLMNVYAVQCIELDFRHITPTEENFGAAFCGYTVGLKHPSEFLAIGYDTFSSQENIDGYRIWKKRESKRICEEGQTKAMQLFKNKYPSSTIKCTDFHNFDAAMDRE